MAKQSNGKPSKPAAPPSISRITVSGFKSIGEEQSIEIAPLTILAGTNSSGKSSIMQPLLLLKQTLECSYDPGALLLDGPNVKFTASEQLLTRNPIGNSINSFSVGYERSPDGLIRTTFERQPGKSLDVRQTVYKIDDGTFRFDSQKPFPEQDKSFLQIKSILKGLKAPYDLMLVRDRCFLKVAIRRRDLDKVMLMQIDWIKDFEWLLICAIHLPGLRGNPQRTYPVSAVGSTFSGTFEPYTASVIAEWQNAGNHDTLKRLSEDLKILGLTWKVAAKRINDAQVEIVVGRLPKQTRGGSRDMVSIADVGFGVSQTLPVLVALHVAKPGQLVYLEQPEIHLHPHAQSAMAEVIANAAKRGVKVVVETHSNLLLLGVQTLVAEGKLDPNLVKLHWFQRNREGMTKITTGELDENGAFGDWPEDFADVALNAEGRFLDAFGSKMGL